MTVTQQSSFRSSLSFTEVHAVDRDDDTSSETIVRVLTRDEAVEVLQKTQHLQQRFVRVQMRVSSADWTSVLSADVLKGAFACLSTWYEWADTGARVQFRTSAMTAEDMQYAIDFAAEVRDLIERATS